MTPRIADPDTPMELVRLEAAKLSFAPMIFQAVRSLKAIGGLDLARERGLRGVTAKDLVSLANVSDYAASLLLEAGLAAGLFAYDEAVDPERFVITRLGAFWNLDPMSQVNTEFVHHVCYRGAFDLDRSLRSAAPVGLATISSAPTVYEGLAKLDPEVRSAWFAFDHFYSDGVFQSALEDLPDNVSHLVDIGGNTGRFARLFAEHRPRARVTLVDLPNQVALAREHLAQTPASDRVEFFPTDLLAFDGQLPAADVYWASQFLDCFSPDQIVHILKVVRRSMRPDSRLIIVETFWNRQRYDAARYCVIATSLYFACIANGNSRMYHSETFKDLVRAAGLRIEHERHDMGVSHSLLRCAPT
ncbi:MAG TPA: methyltransferase [Myxococcota bacterium]|nr:methyltransferase [Myxococcota bacterium]